RIGARALLNQCFLIALDFESMFRAGMVKILLQHNPPQSGYRSDLKVIALLDHLSCMTPMSSSRNRPANQPTPSADLKPRHHLGRGGGGAIVGGTFENHAVSKTCLAIC